MSTVEWKLAATGLVVILSMSGLSGCTANCSTNPGEVSRMCGAAYQLGMNKKLEQHLEDRQAEVDQMKLEAEAMQTRLTESEKLVSDAQLRLRAVDAKTSGAREDARRIAGELELKRMDIETKQEELADLEKELARLRAVKSERQEHVVALEQTKRQLAQTKQEVDSLNAYLEEDLLIRAENALQYD